MKEIKKISSKRSKTEADLEELSRLEFQGGLYMGQDGPVIPADVLEATIVNGAKKSRDGTKAKAAMFVDHNHYLEYDGPKDRDGLWSSEDFKLVKPVTVSRAKIMRTRPYFTSWSLTAIISYDDTQTNESTVLKWLEDAGRQVGICDWRPKYGRFEIEHLNGNH